VATPVGLSVLLFGWDTWRAYLIARVGSRAVYGIGAVTWAAIVTPFGAARLLVSIREWGLQFRPALRS
jgi:hypothetical protein